DLPNDEIDERTLFLPAAKEQIEELIHEWTVGRQRKTGQDRAGYLLHQSAFVPGADSLHDQAVETVGIPDGKFQGDDTAERKPHDRGLFEPERVEKLREVVDQIVQIKRMAQGEAIILASQLICVHAVVGRQRLGHRTKQLKTARHPWDQ